MIHKYFLNGYYIVIDTNSGAVHIVDELAYRILDFFTEKLADECPDEVIVTLENEGFDRQDIIDTYAELKALCDDDSLFSEDTYRPFADMLTEARQIATGRMVKDAEALGADAVVGMRYASASVMQGAAEVIAYGTAVKFV